MKIFSSVSLLMTWLISLVVIWYGVLTYHNTFIMANVILFIGGLITFLIFCLEEKTQ